MAVPHVSHHCPSSFQLHELRFVHLLQNSPGDVVSCSVVVGKPHHVKLQYVGSLFWKMLCQYSHTMHDSCYYNNTYSQIIVLASKKTKQQLKTKVPRSKFIGIGGTQKRKSNNLSLSIVSMN